MFLVFTVGFLFCSVGFLFFFCGYYIFFLLVSFFTVPFVRLSYRWFVYLTVRSFILTCHFKLLPIFFCTWYSYCFCRFPLLPFVPFLLQCVPYLLPFVSFFTGGLLFFTVGFPYFAADSLSLPLVRCLLPVVFSFLPCVSSFYRWFVYFTLVSVFN